MGGPAARLPGADVTGRTGRIAGDDSVPDRELLDIGAQEPGPDQGVTHGEPGGVVEQRIVAEVGALGRIRDTGGRREAPFEAFDPPVAAGRHGHRFELL